jgi:hypothetical protein
MKNSVFRVTRRLAADHVAVPMSKTMSPSRGAARSIRSTPRASEVRRCGGVRVSDCDEDLRDARSEMFGGQLASSLAAKSRACGRRDAESSRQLDRGVGDERRFRFPRERGDATVFGRRARRRSAAPEETPTQSAVSARRDHGVEARGDAERC